jgi:hypothetical protein
MGPKILEKRRKQRKALLRGAKPLYYAKTCWPWDEVRAGQRISAAFKVEKSLDNLFQDIIKWGHYATSADIIRLR